MKAKHSTSTQTPRTSCQAWWWGADDLAMDSLYTKSILESNVRPSVRRLKLSKSSIMQQENDPKYRSNRMAENKNQGGAMAQTPDLKLTERLWQNLKWLSELCLNKCLKTWMKQCCKEEWVKILPQWRERLIKTHKENYNFKLLLLKVILSFSILECTLFFSGQWYKVNCIC